MTESFSESDRLYVVIGYETSAGRYPNVRFYGCYDRFHEALNRELSMTGTCDLRRPVRGRGYCMWIRDLPKGHLSAYKL